VTELYRPLRPSSNGQDGAQQPETDGAALVGAMMNPYLDDIEIRLRNCIQELLHLNSILVRNGRLRV
jgi:hypothetical protein